MAAPNPVPPGVAALYNQANLFARSAVSFDQQGDRAQAALLYESSASCLSRAANADPDLVRTEKAELKAVQYLERATLLKPPSARRPTSSTTTMTGAAAAVSIISSVKAIPGGAGGGGSGGSTVKAAASGTTTTTISGGGGGRSSRLEAGAPISSTRHLRAGDLYVGQAREKHEEMHYTEARKLYEKAAEEYIAAAKIAPPEERDTPRAKAHRALAAAEQLLRALDPERANRNLLPVPTAAGTSQQQTLRQRNQQQQQQQQQLRARSGSSSHSPRSSSRSPSPNAPRRSSKIGEKGPTTAGGAQETDATSPSSSLLPTAANAATVTPVPTPVPSGGGHLTDEEVSVLHATSRINGRVYLPWVPADVRERFSGAPGSYKDPDGQLTLSSKQKRHFRQWSRPADLFGTKSLRMVHIMGSRAVTQTVVSDCSFVSSLAISADYERRFERRIITCNIFPQNAGGDPVVSPSGKYMVRLHFNGAFRKILVDDLLPTDAGNGLLCSYSNNRGELWVSLLEKAYMKVMGGYDFPGSNSAVDMYTLTGWLPQRLPLKDCSDAVFKDIWKYVHTGEVLISLATPPMNQAAEERTGLVETHAYALLDIRELKSHGRLLKIKNPWNRTRWRGRWSPDDTTSWTAEMCAKLKYDVETARRVDNGEFWIDWASVKKFYDVMYLSWNPARFAHRYSLHRLWRCDEGPVRDSYNLEKNPQYGVEVLEGSGDSETDVWVLLSRHITRVEDFGNNKEYITVHVFNGLQRRLYPEGFAKAGTKINSPHYLVKLRGRRGTKFTLVVSQWEADSNIRYTLQVLSATARCAVTELVDRLKQTVRRTGEWAVHTAGGSPNNPASHARNPQYNLKVAAGGRCRIKLEGPREFSVGMEIRRGGGERERVTGSDSYRPGFGYIEFDTRAGETYTVVPATFTAGQLGPFFLTAAAETPIVLEKA